MAQIAPANLGAGTLTASAVAYVTAAANTTVIIKAVTFTNTDVAARTITVHRVPSAGSATTGNRIISAYSLSAGQAYVAPECANLVLAPGETLQALASTAAVVNIAASGFTS
jgi:hypothetical protein